ncbi:MAG TPA: hypothetical protein DEB05_15805, partial [Firmicutes bacterium]|nr:hypothetical protein [Bacillota bacterium]
QRERLLKNYKENSGLKKRKLAPLMTNIQKTSSIFMVNMIRPEKASYFDQNRALESHKNEREWNFCFLWANHIIRLLNKIFFSESRD